MEASAMLWQGRTIAGRTAGFMDRKGAEFAGLVDGYERTAGRLDRVRADGGADNPAWDRAFGRHQDARQRLVAFALKVTGRGAAGPGQVWADPDYAPPIVLRGGGRVAVVTMADDGTWRLNVGPGAACVLDFDDSCEPCRCGECPGPV